MTLLEMDRADLTVRGRRITILGATLARLIAYRQTLRRVAISLDGERAGVLPDG